MQPDTLRRAVAGHGTRGGLPAARPPRRRLMAVLGVVAVAAAVAGARPAQAAASTGTAAGRQAAAAADAAPTGGRWALVWRDDFNGPAGTGVDTADWKYDTGQGIFGTGEIETMTSSASNVHLDGHRNLDITALGQGQTWTSGRIQTNRSGFGAPAGGQMLVMASIRQPAPASGLGYWRAFWMLGPGDWPGTGEVDILEDVNALSEHSGTFHCGNLTDPNPDGTLGPCHEFTGLTSGLLPCAGCQSGYHTYTAVVDRTDAADEQIRWYLDGREFHSVSKSQVGVAAWAQAVDHGFSIIFDLAIGGGYPDGVCGCTTPTGQTTSGGTMSVHYVAVYTRPGSR